MEIREIEFKKKFPFLYIYKREEYIIEKISRWYNMIISLYSYVIFLGLIKKFKGKHKVKKW